MNTTMEKLEFNEMIRIEGGGNRTFAGVNCFFAYPFAMFASLTTSLIIENASRIVYCHMT